MLVSLLAMFVSCVGVLLRLFVFAEIMMMGGLVMMMRRCVVLSGSLVRCSLAECFGDFAMALFLPTSLRKRMRWLLPRYGATCCSRQGHARRLREFVR